MRVRTKMPWKRQVAKQSICRKPLLFFVSSIAISTANCFALPPSQSLREAHPEITAEAVAHYARSRALLIKAINEFDKGRRLSKPDELLDSIKWRNTLIDRAEDIERILAPQPRVTKGGIYFEADPRLLPEAKK